MRGSSFSHAPFSSTFQLTTPHCFFCERKTISHLFNQGDTLSNKQIICYFCSKRCSNPNDRYIFKTYGNLLSKIYFRSNKQSIFDSFFEKQGLRSNRGFTHVVIYRGKYQNVLHVHDFLYGLNISRACLLPFSNAKKSGKFQMPVKIFHIQVVLIFSPSSSKRQIFSRETIIKFSASYQLLELKSEQNLIDLNEQNINVLGQK